MRKGIVVVMVLLLAAIAVFSLRVPLAERSRKFTIERVPMQPPVDAWLLVSLGQPRADVALVNGSVSLRHEGEEWQPLFRPAGPVSYAVSSPGQRAFAVAIVDRRATPEAPGTIEIRAFSLSGRPLASWTLSWPYDRPVPSIFLPDDASSLVVGWSDVAALEILDRSGGVARIALLPGSDYAYERTLYLAPSPQGQSLLVLTTRQPPVPPAESTPGKSGQPVLFEIDLQGEVTSTEDLPGDDITGLHVLAEPAVVLIGIVNFESPGVIEPAVLIRDLRSAQEHRVSPQSPDFFSADQHRRLLFLGDPLRATAIDLSSGAVLWRVQPKSEGRSILGIAAFPETDRCAIVSAKPTFRETGFVYEDARVLAVDPTGETADQIDLPGTLLALPVVSSGPGYLRILTRETELRIQAED